MIVSRSQFLVRFRKFFGDHCYITDDDDYTGGLFCFRSRMKSGDYFYGAPFVVSTPIWIYNRMSELPSEVYDKLLEEKAELVMLGNWRDSQGIDAFDIEYRPIVEWRDLFFAEEDTE